jgi:Ca2+/H+ antiporter, TMEM165/GDT1 family
VLVDPVAIVTTFALIFPAELPDKSFIATLVLATRYRHVYVWLGVALAFAVQVTIAVIAGGLLSFLPQAIVLSATTVLFAAGAVILLRSGLRDRAVEQSIQTEERAEVEARVRTVTKDWQALGIAFAVIFLAEWGDLTQILTAGLAARTGAPLSVGIGAWAALAVVSAIGVLAGRFLAGRIDIWRVRLISAGILAVLAGWSAWELFS